jgi:hypothetical protein
MQAAVREIIERGGYEFGGNGGTMKVPPYFEPLVLAKQSTKAIRENIDIGYKIASVMKLKAQAQYLEKIAISLNHHIKSIPAINYPVICSKFGYHTTSPNCLTMHQTNELVTLIIDHIIDAIANNV